MKKWISCFVVSTVLLAVSANAAPLNGDFSAELQHWTWSGDVNVEGGTAFIADTDPDAAPSGRLYQSVALASGLYTLEFDFHDALSAEVSSGTFADAFFSSLYFIDDILSFDIDGGVFDSSLSLIDADSASTDVLIGTVSESDKGEGWSHYVLNFSNNFEYVVPVFELFDLNLTGNDSSAAIDNVEISAYDFCPEDPDKTSPGICGCGVEEVDENENNIIDCLENCVGVCDLSNPKFDEDGDGVSNCEEIGDGTDSCDSGSFIAKLKPHACAGANGFFQQINILTVINRGDSPLGMWVEYRDLFGKTKGTVSLVLGANLKRDIIVNELGLEPDTYGTVCVFTDATRDGRWSGGLTLYKRNFDKIDSFDYALYYPLRNAKKGKSSAPLNTNTIGTDGLGAVANWVRLVDGVEGDGKGLVGTLFYYDINGRLAAFDKVSLADGGRYDYPGHERLGAHAVGLVEFLPASADALYFFEVTRYLYDGIGANSPNFITAFPLPARPSTGEAISAEVANLSHQTNIIEMINDNGADVGVNLKIYGSEGGVLFQDKAIVYPKTSLHRIIGEGIMAAGTVGVAQVSVPAISVSALTLSYVFDKDGELLFAYAPPFVQSHSRTQYTEFNTYQGHLNRLQILNTGDVQAHVTVRVIDWQAKLLLEFESDLSAHSLFSRELALPFETYGTIVVDSDRDTGIVTRNDVSRSNEYVIPFMGQ